MHSLRADGWALQRLRFFYSSTSFYVGMQAAVGMTPPETYNDTDMLATRMIEGL